MGLPARSLQPPNRRGGARTAQRILNAAEALFAERGFAGTTLRDVANRVGLRIPSLYNHFPSKESLYAAVLERGLRPVFEELEGFAAGENSSARGFALVERLMKLFARHPNLPRLIQHEALGGGERLAPLLREWLRPLFTQAQRLIEEGPTARPWRPTETPLVVLAFYNVIVGYFTIAPFYQSLNGTNLLTEEARARQTRLLQRLVERLFLDRSEQPKE